MAGISPAHYLNSGDPVERDLLERVAARVNELTIERYRLHANFIRAEIGELFGAK